MITRTIAVLALVMASTTNVAAATEGKTVVVKGEGAGKWEMWCKVNPSRGSEFTSFADPSRPELTLTAPRYATCSYKNTSSSDLIISVEGAEKCPFRKPTEAGCATKFPRGAFGDFSL
jgi:hypothetical protein